MARIVGYPYRDRTSTFPAAKLLSTQRIDLATQAMSDSADISRLASEHQVSRKFVYQQKNRALEALNDAFAPTTANDEVLFYLPVTRRRPLPRLLTYL